MDKPDLKIVGEIKPPGYKDPVQMLRNIADDIENGVHGDVETIVVAVAGEDETQLFGGGRDSGMHACAFLFQTCATRLHNIPWGGK